MSTTRHLAEFAAGAPPDAVQAFWRLWFGPTSAPGKIQVDDLTTLMGGNIPDKGEQAMPAGFKYFHGSGYDAGVNRVYFSSRFGTGASPAGGEYRLVRINPDDLSSYSYYEGGANDIWADSLCVTGGKVYVGRSNYLDQTQTLVDVFDVDDSPPVLEATHNLGSYGRVESIDTDGTNLFVGTSDRKVVRCPIASLPTPSHATAALGASGTCHALRYDSQNSKVFVGMGGTDNLFRLAASDLTNEATASLSTGCAITDDMAVVTDYIYVGIEGAGGA